MAADNQKLANLGQRQKGLPQVLLVRISPTTGAAGSY